MSIHRNQDMIDITVSDNGAGMTEEMIAKVMEGRAVQDEENRYSTGIAVHNVIDRLQLYYKQEGLIRSKVTDLEPERKFILSFLWKKRNWSSNKKDGRGNKTMYRYW